MLDISKLWVDFECPNCNYADMIQIVDIRTEKIVFCHNCKTSIQLMDSEASTQQATTNIEDVLKDLENSLKKFGK